MTKKKEAISFDLSDLTIDDLVEFEDGNASSVKFIRDFMGRFVSDNNGGVLPHEEGVKIIGRLPLLEINAITAKFTDAVNKVSDEAVNPTNEENSEPDS